jgi:hypothetical protein
MITKVKTIEKFKEFFAKNLFARTDKVTKIADESVLNGIAYGVAKVGQKVNKDQALIESHIFPDLAYGEYLDFIARDRGFSPRFSTSPSSGYLRIAAEPGTLYEKTVHTFTGNHGIVFELEQDETVGNIGYKYVKVKSQQNGFASNVEPFTVNEISEQLTGHQYVTNEYYMLGGRDEENDEDFKNRIRGGVNILAKHTMEYLRQALMLINPDILRIFNMGRSSTGKTIIAVLKQDGTDLSNAEIAQLDTSAAKYLSISDLAPDWFGVQNNGVEFRSVEFFEFDVSMRLEIAQDQDIELIRKEIQVSISKIIDYRYWKLGERIEWEDLLFAAKSVSGVTYVYDDKFFPRTDIRVPNNKVPRVRGFLLLDKAGAIISSANNEINPVFYPTRADFNFQTTVVNYI